VAVFSLIIPVLCYLLSADITAESSFFASAVLPLNDCKSPSFPSCSSTPRDIEVVIKGDTFTAYINGEAVLTGIDDTYSEGRAGLRTWNATEICFDRFAIGSAPEETE
jgi:hypothetical protein